MCLLTEALVAVGAVASVLLGSRIVDFCRAGARWCTLLVTLLVLGRRSRCRDLSGRLRLVLWLIVLESLHELIDFGVEVDFVVRVDCLVGGDDLGVDGLLWNSWLPLDRIVAALRGRRGHSGAVESRLNILPMVKPRVAIIRHDRPGLLVAIIPLGVRDGCRANLERAGVGRIARRRWRVVSCGHGRNVGGCVRCHVLLDHDLTVDVFRRWLARGVYHHTLIVRNHRILMADWLGPTSPVWVPRWLR